MNTTTPNDIADFIIRTLHAAGRNIGLQHLQNLIFTTQGHHLAITGQPAFPEACTVAPTGPRYPTVDTAYHHHVGVILPTTLVSMAPQVDFDGNPIGNGRQLAAQLPANLQMLVKAVLRLHDNAFTLHDWIMTSPLWAHSRLTENKVDLTNMAAYFKKLPPLALGGQPHPVVETWPYVYEPVDLAAMNRQTLLEEAARQEEESNGIIERLSPAPKKLTLASFFGKGG